MTKGDRIKYDFSNEVALVTGAASGFGESASKAYAKSGAKVVLVDIDENGANEVKNEIIATTHLKEEDLLVLKTDVSNPEEVSKMSKKAIARFAKIDILFNNAGIGKGFLLKDTPFENWRKIMSVNLDGVFLVAQAVGKEMIKRRKGRIVNTASMSAFIVNEKIPVGVYCTSKAGVVMLTKALAVEWAEYNIMVNAIAPGHARTALVAEAIKDPIILKRWEDRTPLHRLAEAEEIVQAVLYLSSSATTYVTGHTLEIDGGYIIW